MTAELDLLKEIDELKLCLNKLILEKECIQDPEIIELSTILDLKLNEYNKFFNKVKTKSTIKR